MHESNVLTGPEILARLAVLDRLLAQGSTTTSAREVAAQALDTLLLNLGERVGVAYVAAEEDGDRLGRATWQGLSEEQATALLSSQALTAAGGQPSPPAKLLALEGDDLSSSTPAGILIELGCRGLLVLPLLGHETPRGYLCIGVREHHALSEEALAFCGTFGRIVGLAVEHSLLYEQMAQRLRQSEALYQVSEALATTLDLDHMLSLIVRSAINTIPKAKNGVLHLLDPETEELRPRALSFVGEVRPDAAGRSGMRLGYGVAGSALAQGQAINIPDVTRDERFVRIGEVRPFRAMLVAPLLLGERRIGTLSVDAEEAHAFAPTDERLLSALATQAASAIENARLVSDLQRSLADLRAAQEQLIQSEKLSAIGQLIAGVAHELNNPLTAIMGYAQLLQTADDLPGGVLRDVDKIYAQAQRAAKIVQNLLTFARQHRAERQHIDINEVIERTLELRAYQLRLENIEIETAMSDEPLMALADPGQMQQVFLNLINNARDAMHEQRKGGRLTVSSALHDRTIVVRLEDDGSGFPPMVQRRLFEPFFTTKEVGQGTGLGLSICYGIVSQHGGRIWGENRPQGGAAFTVELPLAEESAAEAPPPTQSAARPVRRRVLLVEDEESVAAPLSRMLMADGHEVAWAASGEDALRRIEDARRLATPYELIVSDVRMPGMGGRAFYEQLSEREPELARRVILVTGDALSAGTADFIASSGLPCLSKPLTLDDLRAAIVRLYS